MSGALTSLSDFTLTLSSLCFSAASWCLKSTYNTTAASLWSSVTHLKAIVRPAAKLHDAGLLIKREIFDIHLAWGMIDSGWLPLHQTVVIKSCLGSEGHFKVSIRTLKLQKLYQAMWYATINLLVIKHDVWQPNVGWRHVQHVHPAKLLGFPDQLVIVPELLNPKICCHYLISEILQ